MASEMTDSTMPPNLIRNFMFQVKGNLQPVASIVGAIAAQESLKAVSCQNKSIND